jgi:hypothetical protein
MTLMGAIDLAKCSGLDESALQFLIIGTDPERTPGQRFGQGSSSGHGKRPFHHKVAGGFWIASPLPDYGGAACTAW